MHCESLRVFNSTLDLILNLPLNAVRYRTDQSDIETLLLFLFLNAFGNPRDGITSRRQVRNTSPERVSLLPTSDTGNTYTNTLSTNPNTKASSNIDTQAASKNPQAGLNNPQGDWNNPQAGLNNPQPGLYNPQGASNTNSQDTGVVSDLRVTSKSLTSSNTKGLSTNSERGARQAAKDDIPVFDRNKVSLDFPGALFGPSLSLLIKTTKIVGDVIQNSAVRYQSFLRLFRPLFRGPFEIKGLDPPTTTTTTTTTKAPVVADNEVRRR
ncbi:hypothetical protein ABMA27_008082 [Loxostege sticticalis]|uniref:Uncharacterized protein n=1 Tax=Loxostege sticticalis TaxID=481309 RepID=A0ABR3HDW4_LOXSC